MKKISFFLVALAIAMVSCESQIENSTVTEPTVVTKSVTEITESTADVVGQVAADGGTEVTERGVCWNTDGAPTILDYRVKDTAVGVGTFTSKLSDLEVNTTYYVRAYATNAVGTSYGEEKSFTTKEKVNTDIPDIPEGVISCAEALAICKATGTTSTTETYTIRGYVTEIKETFNTQHGNVTYWMADEQGGGKVLLAYRVKPVKTYDQAVKVNDYVEVVGTLVNYNGNSPEVNADGTYTIIITGSGETPDTPIEFQDDNAKLICILHWDDNGDGEFSYEEAAAVTELGTAFKGSRILSFNEFEYFTGLTKIAKDEFADCASLVSISIPAQIIAIETGAFSGCLNIKKINIPALSTWCKFDFSGFDANPLHYGAELYINGVKQTDITIPSDITEIKDYTFYGCISLKSVTIPNSVTSIGYEAFCECNSLTSVTIGNGVTAIGKDAFQHCTSLTSVTIGNSVTSIGAGAFTNCYELTSVNISDLSDWCKISFDVSTANPLRNGAALYINGVKQNDITIPSDITEIKDYAFYGYSALENVTIPNSVTSIGAGAFNNCYELTSVTIGNSVTSIGTEAFYDCSNLTSVTIGNSVTSIGSEAFYGCSNLTSVNISDLSDWCKISFVVPYACSAAANPLYNDGAALYINGVKQTDITIPSDITEIKHHAFLGYSALENVTIPNSITSIGNDAFYGCSNLTSVTIGNSVTSIGAEAFDGCSNLTSVNISDLSDWCKISFMKNRYENTVSANPLHNGAKLIIEGETVRDITIPSDITEIKNYAFYGYTRLKSVTIPNSITSIGDGAFQNCGSLKSVYCKPTTPPKGGSYMFAYYYEGQYYWIGCKFYVPRNSVNAYQLARYWTSYESYIEGYDF